MVNSYKYCVPFVPYLLEIVVNIDIIHFVLEAIMVVKKTTNS